MIILWLIDVLLGVITGVLSVLPDWAVADSDAWSDTLDALASVQTDIWLWADWIPIYSITVVWTILAAVWLAAFLFKVLRNLWDALPFT